MLVKSRSGLFLSPPLEGIVHLCYVRLCWRGEDFVCISPCTSIPVAIATAMGDQVSFFISSPWVLAWRPVKLVEEAEGVRCGCQRVEGRRTEGTGLAALMGLKTGISTLFSVQCWHHTMTVLFKLHFYTSNFAFFCHIFQLHLHYKCVLERKP